VARRRPQSVHWRRRALLLIEPGKHSTGWRPVTRCATRSRYPSERLIQACETVSASGVDDLWECADRIGRGGAAKVACTEGKTALWKVSSSAPFNLQPSEHGRLVASNGKRWLVGGKDVRRTMIPRLRKPLDPLTTSKHGPVTRVCIIDMIYRHVEYGEIQQHNFSVTMAGQCCAIMPYCKVAEVLQQQRGGGVWRKIPH
jgi:hypothetical protein